MAKQHDHNDIPEPESPEEAQSENGRESSRGFSRRQFIKGTGFAVSAGVLATEGLLKAAAPEQMTPGVEGPGPVTVRLQINGRMRQLQVEPRVTLLDALRNRLDLTGAKKVCDRASCGACTVILNGRPVYSCTVLAVDAQGKSIETIEGIAPNGQLHPVSQAFVDNDAQQCGFCTPGFVMAVKAFIDKHPHPTAEEVRQSLNGNLCRCGTYVGIRKATLEAATKMSRKGRRA